MHQDQTCSPRQGGARRHPPIQGIEDDPGTVTPRWQGAPPRQEARPTPAMMQLISLERVFDIWIYLSIRV